MPNRVPIASYLRRTMRIPDGLHDGELHEIWRGAMERFPDRTRPHQRQRREFVECRIAAWLRGREEN